MRRLSLLILSCALATFTACTKKSEPPRTNADTLAEKIVTYLVVEHEPDEYTREMRETVLASLPALTKAYAACSHEQMDKVDRHLRIFFEYEDSQYNDSTGWYAQLADAVASSDAALLTRMKSANIITARTRAIAAELPGGIRRFAEDQMKGADGASAVLWSAIPPGGSLTVSDVQAGQAAAEKFNTMRRQSYSNSYKQITGKDLPRR